MVVGRVDSRTKRPRSKTLGLPDDEKRDSWRLADGLRLLVASGVHA